MKKNIQNTSNAGRVKTTNNCKKRMFLIILVIVRFNLSAQEIPNRLENRDMPQYVFEFDKNVDEALYNKVQGITMITEFKILINKKKVSFYPTVTGRDEKMYVNSTRSEVEEVIKNDNRNKQPYFYIFVKNENKYYPADHFMFRTEHD